MTDAKPEVPKSPLRRIVKRTAWTVAGIVLLLVSYVGGFGVTQWYIGYGATHRGNVNELPFAVAVRADYTLYAPLHMSADSDWLGADTLFTFRRWCGVNGADDEYVSWDRARIWTFDP